MAQAVVNLSPAHIDAVREEFKRTKVFNGCVTVTDTAVIIERVTEDTLVSVGVFMGIHFAQKGLVGLPLY